MRALVAGGLVGLMRLVAGVRARWVGAAPDGGQRVYVANHSSHVDGLAVWAALPPAERARTRPVAAGDYWGASRLRRYVAAEVFHAVLIDRAGSARAGLDAMCQALDAGSSLILFPEGTRGDGETVGRFRAGLYHLAAHRPSLGVVPVYLQNLSRVLPKGKTVPIPILGHATFGAPLRLREGEAGGAFVERVREAVVALRDA